jgi:hypothetical protein
VIGDEPLTIEPAGADGWAKPADAGEAGERSVSTLLVTYIVDSTKVAIRLGDAARKELLATYNEGVRIQRVGSSAWRSPRRATASLPSLTSQPEPYDVQGDPGVHGAGFGRRASTVQASVSATGELAQVSALRESSVD